MFVLFAVRTVGESSSVSLPAVDEDDISPGLQDFETIGHLYRSIEEGLEHLAGRLGEPGLFVGSPRAQATGERFRWTELVAVTDELRDDKVASQFLAGIESTARELEQVFARHGISRIKSVGEPLDPHRHQAMMEIPTSEAAPGTIVEEMQAGYMLKDRLLRPALVAVAKAAE